MKLFVCIADDARLLPHFLGHYSTCGISEFFVAGPPAIAKYVAGFGRQYAIRFFEGLDVEDSIIGGASAVTSMRMRFQSEDEWVVIVDLDEFVEFRGSVTEIVKQIQASGSNVAQGVMYDRFTTDGKIKGFTESSNLRDLYPIKARFIKNVMGGCDTKGVIVRGHLRSKVAHHIFHDEIPYPSLFEISHYKWNDRSLDRLRQAYKRVADKGIPWAGEYKKILDHYERHGRFAWETFGGERA